jgi:hypothetical protein
MKMSSGLTDNFKQFDVGFTDAILYLMITDQKFMRDYSANLNPDLFSDDIRIRMARFASGFYAMTGVVARDLFVNFVTDRCREERIGEARKKLLVEKAQELMKTSEPNVKYISDRLEEFFHFAHLKNVRYLLDRAIDVGDLKSAKEAISKAHRGIKKEDKPIDYFETVEKRVRRREVVNVQRAGVSFLIPSLSRHGVFAHRGEIALIIAPSKRGKSLFLSHAAKCALYQGHNVLHISLENPIGMVEDRYDAMLSGLGVEELRALSPVLKEKVQEISKIAKGKLFLLWKMARSYSPLDMKVDLEESKNEGKRITTVIVDYGEIMKPVGKYSGDGAMRAARDDIFLHLRAIATEQDVVCITAQQTPLKKRTKFRLHMEDGQESSMPAQHSSLIMTLNQTQDEMAANEMRIYVDGYWHGPSGPQVGDILVKQDLSRLQVYLKEMPITAGVSSQAGKI